MKILMFVLLLTVSNINLFAQSISLDFETNYYNSSSFWIDSSQNNIWQIGRPNKLFFDSAFTAPKCIVTDTINFYPINCNSSFTLSLHNTNCTWCYQGIPYLQFFHKFDTDSLHDGGYIEVSFNNGNTWQNIRLDSIVNHNPEPAPGWPQVDYNFYSANDTIIGGIPAFTGKSNGWIYSIFHFDGCWYNFPIDSIMLKFTFKSDSINNFKEGWVIDNIEFGTNICEQTPMINRSTFKVYPLQTNSTLFIENNLLEKNKLEIIDLNGNVIVQYNDIGEELIIDVSYFSKGFYILKFSANNLIETRKIIIN